MQQGNEENVIVRTNVIKRNGQEVTFDITKIINAIGKANHEVAGIHQMNNFQIRAIADNIAKKISNYPHAANVEDIQDMVETGIMEMRGYEVAQKYVRYRYKREISRKSNTTDDGILSLIELNNEEVKQENSNKNPVINSTQRDYMAGEVSKDLTRRLLLPEEIVKAHDEGIIHFHDADYFAQKEHNCDLINLEDMLQNGTVISQTMIEKPHSFFTACNVTTQIVAQVASNQYGGQSVNIKHLGKYLRKSKEKFAKQLEEEFGDTLDQAAKDKIVQMRVHDELKSGVQTIQYQINTLMTTNGQSPFVTLFLHIDENDEYVEETVQIIMEILRQRIEGTKNEKGVYVTPAFPKLVYVLDENNCLKGGKYDYVTKLAAQCSAKRMYPDYISAKKMRENYEGNVFSCMGCRSFLSPWKDENGEYKWEGRFNQGVVSINLPQIGILAKGNEEKFWKLLDERLELCYEALMCRHKALEGVVSDVSPIHWQYGAIARLKKGETIDKYLHNGYSTMSLGYIGLYETTYLMKGCSQTVEPGKEFALRVMDYMKDRCAKWKEETGIAFSLYGTPAETLCYRFARIDREKYGDISNVTDKGYYTNSYHVDVREKIDAFTKFKIESEFQNKSLGGAISYVEVPNLTNNVEAIEEVIRFIYDNIQYGEFNTKSDYCHVCGYDGEIMINDNMEWECPQCHNKDHAKMNVTRRTCGYLGENFWNAGKTKEIKARVLHL